MTQPNIIFIMADQLAAGSIGCYGSHVNSTPTIDGLAKAGARFERCYVSATVCAPNRATILTGRSPVIHGIVTNNLDLTDDNPTYAQVLQSQGYHTGGFGKFHHTCMGLPLPKDFKSFGFDETVISEDPKWGDYINWIEREHPDYYKTALSMCWGLPFVEKELKAQNRQAVAECLNERRQESDWSLMYSSPLPKELHQTTFITDKALGFMSESIKEQSDQPFFCFVSYVDPHDPYDPPAPYDTMFEPDDMPDPIDESWVERGNSILKNSQKFCEFDTVAQNKDTIKKLRALYHGSIKFVDDQVNRIVEFINKQGLADNTIIVFTTDHGDMIGDHELITKGVKFYDKGIRCPLIVYGKGIEPSMIDRLTCSLDFFPSFCDWAKIDNVGRPPLEGKSFVPLCYGQEENDSWKEVTVESTYSEEGSAVRGIITDDNWRFTIFDLPNTGEMFNLNEDPDEQVNLFYNDEYNDKKFELYERMTHAFMRSSKTHQYRNLPVKDGDKCMLTDGFGLRNNLFQV